MPLSPLELVLRHGRLLHRAAWAEHLSTALPVLRRLHSAGFFPKLSLVALHRQQAGLPNWERMRDWLSHGHAHDLGPILLAQERSAGLHCWSSEPQQAQTHAAEHGGRVVHVGRQAVVIAADALAAWPDWTSLDGLGSHRRPGESQPSLKRPGTP